MFAQASEKLGHTFDETTFDDIPTAQPITVKEHSNGGQISCSPFSLIEAIEGSKLCTTKTTQSRFRGIISICICTCFDQKHFP